MAKFSKKPAAGDKGRSRSTSTRKAGADKEKPAGYKAKRSFSKNKSFRENKDTDKRKSFDRPFKKDYKKEGSDFSAKPRRSREEEGESRPPRRSFGDSERSERPARSFDRGEKSSFSKDRAAREDRAPRRDSAERSERPFRGGDRDEQRRPSARDRSDRPARSGDREEKRRPSSREESPRSSRPFDRDKKPAFKKDSGFGPKRERDASDKTERGEDGKKRRFTKPRPGAEEEGARRVKYDEFEDGKAFSRPGFGDKAGKKPSKKQSSEIGLNADGLIRLNKYLSNAGIASRREADTLIQSGAVKVNGVVIDQLGYKIKPGDKVTYGDESVKSERKVYLLLNKPKDYITTVDDPQERKTVMELIRGACRERVYPVGRLDRNTTGLLLFTNDGELTTKLTHPKFGIKKVYHVSLNKGLKPDDFKAITEGVELEDGFVKADDLAFVGEGKKEIGIEIHSGRNRIVRRLFEHLGYDVLKLDRVLFAGLTKKDLPRGKHRFLTAKEISYLKMIG